MEIKKLENTNERIKKAIITIGNFDGVHLGHQKIIEEVVKTAKKIKGTSIVMTFDPHPMRFFHPEKRFPLLTLCDEKARIIEKFGIDILLCVTFNSEFASIEPEDFIKNILVDKLKIKHLIIGKDYRFGKDKKGDVKLSKKYGFGITVVNPVKLKGTVIKSSRIRAMIQKGNVSGASKFLGRPYSIEGTVIKGTGRGSKILGFPTANILTSSELIPSDGVYAVKVKIESDLNNNKKNKKEILYNAVCNIGTNPTFGPNELSIEVHIPDFNMDLLHKMVKIYFIERIRPEKKFPGPEKLVLAIKKDIKKAMEILSRK